MSRNISRTISISRDETKMLFPVQHALYVILTENPTHR
jgi:hypothetical protein